MKSFQAILPSKYITTEKRNKNTHTHNAHKQTNQKTNTYINNMLQKHKTKTELKPTGSSMPERNVHMCAYDHVHCADVYCGWKETFLIYVLALSTCLQLACNDLQLDLRLDVNLKWKTYDLLEGCDLLMLWCSINVLCFVFQTFTSCQQNIKYYCK